MGDLMGRRWLGSFLILAGAGGLALLPRPAHSTSCEGPAHEWLRLEPVSLEVGGVQVEGWVDDASELRVSLVPSSSRIELVSEEQPGDLTFIEAFDANPTAAR